MDRCTQDLVGSGWEQDVVEAAEQESRAEVRDHCRTTAKLAENNRPHSSDELTASSIRNQSVLPILMARKWDPGPKGFVGEIKVAKGKWINRVVFRDLQSVDQELQEVEPKFQSLPNVMANAAVQDPGDLAPQFVWRLEDGIRQQDQIPLSQLISMLNQSFFSLLTKERRGLMFGGSPGRLLLSR